MSKSWFLIVKAAAKYTSNMFHRLGAIQDCPRLFFFPPPVWPWNRRTFGRHRDWRWSVAMKSFNWRFGGNMREPYLFIIQFWNTSRSSSLLRLVETGSFFNWDLAGICRQRVIQVPRTPALLSSSAFLRSWSRRPEEWNGSSLNARLKSITLRGPIFCAFSWLVLSTYQKKRHRILTYNSSRKINGLA